MATSTTNYSLVKPATSDSYNVVTEFNANMDTIDTTLFAKVDKETGKVLSTNDYTTAEKTKLGYVGATILAYSDSALTTTTGTETKIIVNQTTFNTSADVFEIASDGIKCKIAGTYNVSVKTSFQTTGTAGRIGCSVMHNTTQYLLNYPPLRENYQKCMGSITLSLAANDILYLYCYQNSTANRALDNTLGGNFINVVKIG